MRVLNVKVVLRLGKIYVKSAQINTILISVREPLNQNLT